MDYRSTQGDLSTILKSPTAILQGLSPCLLYTSPSPRD